MPDRWIDHYAAAWTHHADIEDSAAIEEYLGFLHPAVRYEDVPSGGVYNGVDGVRAMCGDARLMSADLTITILAVVCNGGTFAIEAEGRGTNTGAVGPVPATRRPFVTRTVSFGELSDDGLVTAHRDYWDLATFLGQVGLLPDRSGQP